MTTWRGCRHLPPNWRWEGDTYRGTRVAVRFTDRENVDLLSYLIEHGSSVGHSYSEEYLRMVREESAWYVQRPCAYGHCTDTFCPLCGVYHGGWGPVECPCEDGWKRGPHPDQWRKRPAPVKKNRTRKRALQRGHQRRDRGR